MRVLLFLFPRCAYREVAAAVAELGEHAPVDVVGATRGVVKTADGVGIEATLARAEVDPSAYDVVLVPGGDIEEPLHDPEGLELLGAVADQPNIVIGGICNGAVVLGAAGVLDGRRATHPVRPPAASKQQLEILGPHVEAAHFMDEDVVVDRNLITAKPWADAAFARAVVDRAYGV